jgi:hypothetical protein
MVADAMKHDQIQGRHCRGATSRSNLVTRKFPPHDERQREGVNHEVFGF